MWGQFSQLGGKLAEQASNLKLDEQLVRMGMHHLDLLPFCSTQR